MIMNIKVLYELLICTIYSCPAYEEEGIAAISKLMYPLI